jgi:hypothetical protein
MSTVRIRAPLSWPAGWRRTAARRRTDGAQFYSQYGTLTFELALRKLADEMRLLGARDAILSCDSSDWPDPGVALYFRRNGQSFVIACDRYANQAANCRSIGIAISAMRSLERHGGGAMTDRALAGFVALPPPSETARRNWREVLGLDPDDHIDEDVIERAFRVRALKAHPDMGGSNEAMAELNTARDQALNDLRK